MIVKIITNITIIVGPVGVSNKTEEYNPRIIDKIPIMDEFMPIWSGELDICLAEAAGIINIEVTNNIPTILTHVATNIISRVKKITWITLVFILSDFAIFSSIVINTNLFQIIDKAITTNNVAMKNQSSSSEVTVKISPNRYESKFTFLFNKLIETMPIDNEEWANMPNNVSLEKIFLFWR